VFAVARTDGGDSAVAGRNGVRVRESGIRNQESGGRNQESGVRRQESGIRNQKISTLMAGAMSRLK
jgi:hypothetical protein